MLSGGHVIVYTFAATVKEFHLSLKTEWAALCVVIVCTNQSSTETPEHVSNTSQVHSQSGNDVFLALIAGNWLQYLDWTY